MSALHKKTRPLRGLFFSTLARLYTPAAPLPLRSQAPLAPLASPRLLRAAPRACSWLTWGQDNPETNVVAPGGRVEAAAER
jgi:hypothetical protein